MVNKIHMALTVGLIVNSVVCWDVMIKSNDRQDRQLVNHKLQLFALCQGEGNSASECYEATRYGVVTKPKGAVEVPAQGRLHGSPAREERGWQVEVIENGRSKRLNDYINGTDGVLR